MKLVSTTISNFRSITSAYKVALHDFTVLVGPNNEGKSNVLAAISMALSLLERGQFRLLGKVLRYRYIPGTDTYNWERDFPIRMQSTQPNGKSEITLEFELSDNERPDFKKKTTLNLSTNLKLKVAFGQDVAQVDLLLQGKAKTKIKQAVGDDKVTAAIASFVASKIMLKYIPAVRTAGMAEQVINEMLRERLAVLESDPNFKKHLEAIVAAHKPILDDLGKELRSTIGGFIPEVTDVILSTTQTVAKAIRSAAEISIDDGVSTPIQMKGDGIKSLLAIALMKHWSEAKLGTRSLVLAVEEPESHLHPLAIHRLRDVLRQVAANSQVILTTHSAPLVDREVVARNVIVKSGSAKSADSIQQVRDALGVKQSDNLTSARLVVVVEGDEDAKVLTVLLAHRSLAIARALASGEVAFDAMGGCGNLEHRARMHATNVCSIRIFLDNDDAGRKAYDSAEASGAVRVSECTMASLPGYKNTELEDLISIPIYLNNLNAELGLSLTESGIAKDEKKYAWSERIKNIAMLANKPYNKKLEAKLKSIVCDSAAADPANCLNPKRNLPINALQQSIEGFLTTA
jgi:putative ATP-dependent endonuclease of the OLD family